MVVKMECICIMLPASILFCMFCVTIWLYSHVKIWWFIEEKFIIYDDSFVVVLIVSIQ